jgi:hypothetical protein
MAVNLSFIGGAGWQFLDDNGNPLSGGKIYTYAAGTTNPQATYTSRTGLIANTNPIILDSAGRTPEQIWSTEGLLYKYVVTTSADVVIRTWDNIGGSVVASDLAVDLASTTDNTKGDALIGFKQSNASGFMTGAVARTVNTKLQEIVSVKDFGATGNGIVANEQPFIQAAIDAVAANGGGTVKIPAGTYNITAQIVLKPGVSLVGDGSNNTIIDHGTTSLTAITTPSVTPTSLTQTNNLLEGQKTNTITNTCQAGDFINYRNSNLFTDRWANRVVRSYYYEAELFEVASATGSVVTFTEGAVINAPVATTLTVEFFTPNSGFKVQGIKIRKSSAVINYSKGLYIQQAKNVVIDDVATENYDDSGIQIYASMYVASTNTRHIGGSDSLGLCYGVTYIDGTKHCTHNGLIGRRCRHVFANGGSGYSLPMHCTITNIQATESLSHSVDCHADSAYFVFSNITADSGTVVSGLGHQVTNAVAFANTTQTMPYEGGLNVKYVNYTIQEASGNAVTVYTNEVILDSTFENVTVSGNSWNLLSFRSSSFGNIFKNWSISCPPVSTAASSAAASAFLTVDSRSIGQIAYDFCRLEGFYVQGFVWGIAVLRPDVILRDFYLYDCGWNSSTLDSSIPSIIYIADASRTRIENVNINNQNANLTWNGRIIRVIPDSTMVELTIENVSNSLTATSPSNLKSFSLSSVNANVQQFFLKNFRALARTSDNDFNATSGKYIYQTLTTDN